MITEEDRYKRCKITIKSTKYLADKKYYKNNVWSLAAFDSWAANGQAGGCGVCGVNYYNASLENKRRPARSDNKWQCNYIKKVCKNCQNEIENIIGFEFKRR